jgi:hypothetical protein
MCFCNGGRLWNEYVCQLVNARGTCRYIPAMPVDNPDPCSKGAVLPGV